jgi:hypothetical protein
MTNTNKSVVRSTYPGGVCVCSVYILFIYLFIYR